MLIPDQAANNASLFSHLDQSDAVYMAALPADAETDCTQISATSKYSFATTQPKWYPGVMAKSMRSTNRKNNARFGWAVVEGVVR